MASDEAGIVEISAAGISAGIAPLGAELQYLRDEAGRDLLWDGDPAFWTGRAPLLFPIVGALNGDAYRLDGGRYAMAKHGFARRQRFTPITHRADSVTLRLAANDATRASYPFEFNLDVCYSVFEQSIRIEATLANRSDVSIPASFGFHPALRWPLPYGQPRAAHAITFAAPEPASIRRLDAAGLIAPYPHPTPIADHTLALDDALFAEDAIILDHPASRSIRYGAPGGPGLRVDFPDMPMLGIWTKPGAGFICIEPWQGIADPEGFDGAFFDKPGIVVLPPHGERTFAMSITIEA